MIAEIENLVNNSLRKNDSELQKIEESHQVMINTLQERVDQASKLSE